jgi:enoyl-CoA hydratase
MTADAAQLRVERDGRVGIAVLDRPEARNALSVELLAELVEALVGFDRDPGVGAVVIAGSERVFASGADVRMLSRMSPTDNYLGERARQWESIRSIRTPVVAAVSGFCLGAGCELALSCDVVVASETARFGLPETQLGLVPGAGGTQMLTRAIGKTKAMDVILAGRLLTCQEAEQAGLVARVASMESWLADACEVARSIAARPAMAQVLAKESVRRALDVPLEGGIEAERRAFAMALGTPDAREGLAAFLEKRDPQWQHHGEAQ